MMILKITEEFRCETEDEAKRLIENCRQEGAEKGFEVTSWNVTKKEKKSKGEIIDEAVHVKVQKKYSDFWE